MRRIYRLEWRYVKRLRKRRRKWFIAAESRAEQPDRPVQGYGDDYRDMLAMRREFTAVYRGLVESRVRRVA